MTVFTPQERRVVLFLLASLITGSAVKVYRTRQTEPVPHLVPVVPIASRPDTRRSALDTIIKRVERRLEGAVESDLTEARIDINTASEGELRLLPGIGPKLAKRIVAYRESHGKFKDIRGLVNVPGIGEKKLALIREMVKVGQTSQAQAKQE